MAARRGVTSVKTLGHPGRDLSDCCTELLEFQRGFLSFKRCNKFEETRESFTKQERIQLPPYSNVDTELCYSAFPRFRSNVRANNCTIPFCLNAFQASDRHSDGMSCCTD